MRREQPRPQPPTAPGAPGATLRPRRGPEPWMRVAVWLVRPLLLVWTRPRWRGQEQLQRPGGVVLAVNHTSYADPLVVAHWAWAAGRAPRFLAKAELFALPVVGRVLRGAGQVPVQRGSADAALASDAAVEAVRRGECVVVYPEATITSDPGLWPMAGRSGAARIALRTGAPLVPVAQWGAHELLPPGTARPRLGRRVEARVTAGDPVDLRDLAARVPPGHDPSPAVAREATERLLDALTALVATLRPGEQPPPRRVDPGAARGGAA